MEFYCEYPLRISLRWCHCVTEP